MIKKEILGSTNICISKIGLGTVKFGRDTDVKYPQKFSIPDQNQLIELLELCQKYGINTLDTAPAYGDSEKKLGILFKKNNSISRENWVIIDKAGEIYDNGQSLYNFSADFINESINKSLKNLSTNYIDILLIHSNGNDQEIADNDKLWQVLEYRKKQGDIKAYGVSSKTINGGLACLAKSDVAMITYRKDYQVEKPLLDYAHSHKKGIILKKVLNSGHMTANNTASDCLKFSASHPAVNSLIIGTINPLHLIENIKAINA